MPGSAPDRARLWRVEGTLGQVVAGTTYHHQSCVLGVMPVLGEDADDDVVVAGWLDEES